MHLTASDIEGLERRKRAALINSITGYKPANLVGTANTSGHSNLAIMSSLVHIGSHPPLLALIFRPDNAERHTLDNIRETGSYTINHVHTGIVDAAHQTAARYPANVSEFAATGLTELWRDGQTAPFVAEAAVRMGMTLRDELPLNINGTHLVIGEIVSLEVPSEAINELGALDPAKTDSVAISGLDSYYQSSLLQRMAYAKPGKAPQRL
ncbi:flavin reductase family protein [Congregibacter sp.]|jgi:flavin reductase (DIM6/NTAB) family NADH-FMN oxidoreductase RutF|uniref:flavin reductase family protein n=1 Tax=Congregibacter sp. TaxID=2744308 RepID=UPI0039E5FFE3